MEAEVLSEVPLSLKRLVRLVTRGFYEIHHAIIIDLLVHHPCLKEDDILELLYFEKKQLRAFLNSLKTDKFLKSRMRVETTEDGKMSKHNYWFINYGVFVNVIKYKLDHMRRKIETEERDSANRASYRCPNCEKTFTDLMADQLFDPMEMKLLCTYCRTEVVEEVSTVQRTDSRTLMMTFNEQMQPFYDLLREVEDYKLAANILEPEPVDISTIRANEGKKDKGSAAQGGPKWSGEASRNTSYGIYDNQVTVDMDADQSQAQDNKPKKEQPVWMTKSTIDGVVSADASTADVPSMTTAASDSGMPFAQANDDIMRTLLAHEKKASAPTIPGGSFAVPGGGSEAGSSSSDSEDEQQAPVIKPPVKFTLGGEPDEMESEEEDEVAMVTLGDMRIPYDQVTPDMVARMTHAEKDAYVRLGQEMYEQAYE